MFDFWRVLFGVIVLLLMLCIWVIGFLINYFNSVGVADFVTWFLLLVVVSWCLFGFACCVLVLIGLCLWLFWMWGGWRVLMLNAGGCYVAVI